MNESDKDPFVSLPACSCLSRDPLTCIKSRYFSLNDTEWPENEICECVCHAEAREAQRDEEDARS